MLQTCDPFRVKQPVGRNYKFRPAKVLTVVGGLFSMNITPLRGLKNHSVTPTFRSGENEK